MIAAPSRVVLVGFMGAGKTTVGTHLARRLDWPFVDLDQVIEARTGRSIPEIFERDGEPAFRESERGAAEEASSRERVVIAAGGGAFADERTRAVLRAGALTVWLRCAPDALLARIPLDGSRPLARTRETILPLLAAREPAYRLADLTVDTTSATPERAALIIATTLERLWEAQGARG